MLNWRVMRNGKIDMGDQWNVGGELPLHPHRISLRHNDVRDLQVVAHGPELELIRDRFSNLRMSRGSQVVWYGDDAAFILNNLPKANSYIAANYVIRAHFTSLLERWAGNPSPENIAAVLTHYFDQRQIIAHVLPADYVRSIDLYEGSGGRAWERSKGLDATLGRIFSYMDGDRFVDRARR